MITWIKFYTILTAKFMSAKKNRTFLLNLVRKRDMSNKLEKY